MKQRGFTLVEVVVGLALMAVLAVLSWRGLDTMVRTRDSTQARIDAVAAAQIGLSQWRADLNAMHGVPGVLGGNSLAWDGRVMRLLRRSGSPQAQGQDAGLQVTAWTVRDGQWRRWQSADLRNRVQIDQAWSEAAQWGQNPSSQALQQEAKLMPADRWQLFYLRDNAWANPLSSDGHHTPALLNPPDAIRMALQLDSGQDNTNKANNSMDQGAITLDWVRPDFNPNRGGPGSR
jgi:general secretion pathway protein J